jgi:hypothetical protein
MALAFLAVMLLARLIRAAELPSSRHSLWR